VTTTAITATAFAVVVVMDVVKMLQEDQKAPHALRH
jgi:hypothetical protein